MTQKYGEAEIDKARLETWESDPNRLYTVSITFPEFTCLCPRSGYPDFATVSISYTPFKLVVELKSLKLWLNKYRARYISHEEVTNEIFEALMSLLQPRTLEVTLDFTPRGNVHTIVTRKYASAM